MPKSTPPESLAVATERLVATARRALARAAGREVPEDLARAVAEGRGDRGRVAAACCDLFGVGAEPLALVLCDAARIAAFVFESIRPPVLAGASKILRGLNDEIGRQHPDETVYSGGGEALLLVDARRAPSLCEEIERSFFVRSGGALHVSTAYLPVSPADFVAAADVEAKAAGMVRVVTGTQAVLARLRDRVQLAKQWFPTAREIGEGTERCVSCRDRAAGRTPSPRTDRDGECEGYLCDACGQRWAAGRELIRGTSFEDLVKVFQQARLGERAAGARAQYLGFLYADGNAMGNFFGGLSSLAELRFASRAVSSVFQGADRRAHGEVARLVPVDQSDELPLLSLLGGGDEAIWIAPGAVAVQLAERLGGWIRDEVAAVPGFASFLAEHGVPELTFGAGLVLCDLGFPVLYQHELAKELCKSAKGMFHGFHGAPAGEVASSIDFAVLTGSAPWSENLAAARGLAYRTDDADFLRTCRPYRYQEFSELLRLARRASAKGLGKSQLHALQSGASEGRAVFLNYLRYQLARGGVGESYRGWMEGVQLDDPAAIERFFLRRLAAPSETERWGTWVVDLLELKPFVDLLAGGVEGG
jgi:hypothetical protein